MKKMILAIALVAMVAFAGQAFGELCATDNVPAATLLIPYFSADISEEACADDGAPTTFFSVANASDGPVVAHVTYWTDFTVPEIDYDIYLTGYDVEVVNIKNVFCTGDLPQTTATAAIGPFSVANAAIGAGCGGSVGTPPNYNSPAITENFRLHLRAVFTGQQSPVTGLCGGTNSAGDDIAHGYVTIDASRDCSILFPDDDGYFNGTEVYTDETGNVLWGDYAYVDRNRGTSEGFAAVHIEAYGILATTTGPTFYGRYTDYGAGFTWADAREPLPTTYAARYNRGGAFEGTDYQVWREGYGTTGEVVCGSSPFSYAGNPCNDGIDFRTAGNHLVAFNESELVEVPQGGASGEPTSAQVCIPWETQEMLVGSDLPTTYLNGWYYMNLQNSQALAGSVGQGYLTVTETLLSNEGVFSGGWHGSAWDGSCLQFAAGVTVTPAQPTAPFTNPGD